LAALAARRAARVRDAAELTGLRRQGLWRRGCGVPAGDAECLPLAVLAPVLRARLAGRRAVGGHRPLVVAVVNRHCALGAEPEERHAKHREFIPYDRALHFLFPPFAAPYH